MYDSTYLFLCKFCKARVQLVKDGEHYYNVYGEQAISYIFGHCVKCSSPGLAEYAQIDENKWSNSQLYPSLRVAVDGMMPPKVAESYNEAINCELAGVSIATAVMVRRTLEAIGKEFAPNSRNLFQGLQNLLDQGIISNEMREWGDELRFLGNIGAHPTEHDAVTQEEAKEAIEFLNAIVETIYHLRPRFQAMKARRAGRP